MDYQQRYETLVKKLRDSRVRQAFIECGGGIREVDFHDFEATIGKEFSYNPDTDKITRKGQPVDFAAEIKYEIQEAQRQGRKVLPALFDGDVQAIASDTLKLDQSQFNDFLQNPRKFGVDATPGDVPALIKTGKVLFVQQPQDSEVKDPIKNAIQ